MKNLTRNLIILFVSGLLVVLFVSCQPAPEEDVLYINLTWHQHQPLYYKDADGVYTRPWVRVHATKDYLDMAQKVADYEDIRVTFNLTPSLIRQLEDIAAGAKDKYWVLAEKPVTALTDQEKTFILERFFDINWTNIIAQYPRYQELLDKRGGADQASLMQAMEIYTDQDFLDLQIWFNLAWFDPVFLAEEPLVHLVEKGRDFSEDDKPVLFSQVREVVQEVLPYHKQLQNNGQIEITTSPYAHPILPLIFDNQLALVGNPSAEMPEFRFEYPQDAQAQLALGVEMYQAHFGREVRGLWPSEGAVAQAIVPMVIESGFTYMQTGEPVLAKSLGIDSFTRDSQSVVQEADLLYRPYYVSDGLGNQAAIFFRDWTLSDNIGFVYSNQPGESGAADLVNRLEAIHANLLETGAAGPHIVSIILDGENAWEHYPNDGNDFLNALYQKLSDSEVLKTVTPSEYLEMFPEQRSLDELFPGAWFSPNYDTWIGETEEAIAWDYLARVRKDLEIANSDRSSYDPDVLERAFDFMYLAEGSDWFWWFGDDQDSGQDSYFDEGFRALLAGVYESLGEEIPQFIQVPIIQAQPVAATRPFLGISSPEIDGEDDAAWDNAAYYQASGAFPVSGLYYTLDKENIYLRMDKNESLIGKNIGFYFSTPGIQSGATSIARNSNQMLGFNANKLVEWRGGVTVDVYDGKNNEWDLFDLGAGRVRLGDELVEFALPLRLLGDLSAGDVLKLAMVIEPDGLRFPVDGPAQVVIPDLGETTVVLRVQDPVGDDYGPGTYIYPEDVVFKESVFDAKFFEVGFDQENLVLTFGFVVPVENPWGSPLGLSLQTMDIYIDKDPGEGTGARILLPGRNAALQEGYGWEYAIMVEGWEPQVFQIESQTNAIKPFSEASSAMKIIVDAAKNAVVVRIPLSFFGEDDPTQWAYAAVVLSQDGYASEGVWRVRDVETTPAQYRFGGGPEDSNHTRIIDLILPEGSALDQATLLSNYPSTQESIDNLAPEDFAQIPMLVPDEN